MNTNIKIALSGISLMGGMHASKLYDSAVKATKEGYDSAVKITKDGIAWVKDTWTAGGEEFKSMFATNEQALAHLKDVFNKGMSRGRQTLEMCKVAFRVYLFEYHYPKTFYTLLALGLVSSAYGMYSFGIYLYQWYNG